MFVCVTTPGLLSRSRSGTNGKTLYLAAIRTEICRMWILATILSGCGCGHEDILCLPLTFSPFRRNLCNNYRLISLGNKTIYLSLVFLPDTLHKWVKWIFKNNYAILGYRSAGSGGYEMKYKINGNKLIQCVKERKRSGNVCVFWTAIWSVTYSFERPVVLFCIRHCSLYVITLL